MLNNEYHNLTETFTISTRKASGHYTMPSYHLHDQYEIYYLLSGERSYFIKDRTFTIQQGDLVLINQSVLHKTIDTGVPNHERFLIKFSASFIQTSENQLDTIFPILFLDNSPVIRLNVQEQSHINGLFHKMIDEVSQKPLGFELYAQGLLLQMLVVLSRHPRQNHIDLTKHPSAAHEKVSEIVQYINLNYSQNITLTSLSKQFFISSFYLSKIFKTVTGFTFINYLNSVRVKEAQKMLRETRLKVIDIAERVGFGNISHFGRVFKELTDKSPLQYRKQNQS